MFKYNIVTVTIMLLIGASSYGQCKRFHKQECAPTLPETHVLVNQYMLPSFFFGDEASLDFSVVPNRDYRINLCTQESIKEGTFFTLAHSTGEVFYDSREHAFSTSVSFVSESEDSYILRVKNEKPRKGDIIPSGCLSILIGMQLD